MREEHEHEGRSWWSVLTMGVLGSAVLSCGAEPRTSTGIIDVLKFHN
jgi:hypothetical protein